MSFVADNDARERVRQATDITELVNAFVPLRRSGRNMVGLCWMHDDSKPSLTVNPQRQSWRCFVCNVGGDVFSFVQQYHKLGFREALEMLADRAGIALSPVGHRPLALPGSPADKKTLLQAMEWAERQFHDCLLHSTEAESARAYLAERRITAESIARFRIGFAPGGWQWLLDRARSTAFSAAVLEACNLAKRREDSSHFYDVFRGRVMFPIHDTQGRPIAFGGRVMPGATDPQKYINSTETPLFVKRDNLYALSLATSEIRSSKSIVIMEGYTDVVIAHQVGVRNAVAVLGTALNAHHVRIAKRYADIAYLVLDGDKAGQDRTNAVLEHFLTENMDLRIVTLPDNLDPADFLLVRPLEDFKQLLANSVDALEHRIATATRGIDLVRDSHRANLALEQILGTFAKSQPFTQGIPTAVLLREQQLLAQLARRFSVPEEVLRQRLKELRRKSPYRESITVDELSTTTPATSTLPPEQPMPPKEIELLEILLQHPELVSIAAANIESTDLISLDTRTIFDIFVKLDAEGEPPEFARVMAELTDLRLQSLTVQCDEQGQAKSLHALQPAIDRLRLLINDFRDVAAEQRRREQVSTLASAGTTPEQEIELLRNLLNEEKRKRGLTTSTEG